MLIESKMRRLEAGLAGEPLSTTAHARERAFQDAAFLTWLVTENGYRAPRVLPDGRWAAVMPLLFTAAIMVGQIGDRVGCDDRWCYGSDDAAREALRAWDGAGEPGGWHRHPATGRRRPEGDAEREYVNP